MNNIQEELTIEELKDIRVLLYAANIRRNPDKNIVDLHSKVKRIIEHRTPDLIPYTIITAT